MARHLTRIALLFGLAAGVIAAAPTRAAAELECIVAMQTKSGWTTERRRTVHFLTGLELARITTTLHVELRQVYAVIIQIGGLPTVVRLDTTLLGVGREFTPGDLSRLFDVGNEHLATQLIGEGRTLKWRLRNPPADSVAQSGRTASPAARK